MSSSKAIEPALSSGEWETIVVASGVRIEDFDGPHSISYTHDLDGEGRGIAIGDANGMVGLFNAACVRQLIALANSALPDSDARKLTDRHVAVLRDAARVAEGDGNHFTDLVALGDLLESYLPPDVAVGSEVSPH